MAGGTRLDQWLADNGHAPSRARARDLVLRGLVRVDGVLARKPAQIIHPNVATIDVDEREASFVSRSARKLLTALEMFGRDPRGLVCADIGASTGGFTQILLEAGAARIYAVDVGRDQLHQSLRDASAVVSLEATDARSLTTETITEPLDVIVADVSFISVRKVLGPVLALASAKAWLVVLVKPQFEVGPDGVGKGGIVRDAKLARRAVDDVVAWLDAQSGWHVTGEMPSPIKGGDGNQEFLVTAERKI